jgi:hypothetical protein
MAHTDRMNLKTIKFNPVAWMTTLLTVLGALEAANEALHFLPASWSPYLLGAIAVLTAVLGKLVHNNVTALARPRDDAGNPLVPKWAAGDTAAPRIPPGGSIGGAGMRSW